MIRARSNTRCYWASDRTLQAGGSTSEYSLIVSLHTWLRSQSQLNAKPVIRIWQIYSAYPCLPNPPRPMLWWRGQDTCISGELRILVGWKEGKEKWVLEACSVGLGRWHLKYKYVIASPPSRLPFGGAMPQGHLYSPCLVVKAPLYHSNPL